jgi:hypothetical protein
VAMEKSREKVEVGETGQRAGRAMRTTHSVHNKSLRAVAKCEYNSECASSLRRFAACRARYLENTVGKSLSLPCHIASVELSPSSSQAPLCCSVVLTCPLSICELCGFHIFESPLMHRRGRSATCNRFACWLNPIALFTSKLYRCPAISSSAVGHIHAHWSQFCRCSCHELCTVDQYGRIPMT